MRIRVKDVLEMLAGWASEDQILADYPDLEREDIRACLEYAAQYFDHPVVFGGGYAVSCRRPVAAVVGSETGKGSLRWASGQKADGFARPTPAGNDDPGAGRHSQLREGRCVLGVATPSDSPSLYGSASMLIVNEQK